MTRKQLSCSFSHHSLTWMPKPGPGAKFLIPIWAERFLGELQLRPSSQLSTIMVLDGWQRWKQTE